METYPLQLLVRQTNAVLYAHLVTNATLLTENSDALHLDTILVDAGGVAIGRGGSSLDAGPGPDAAAPADDGI
jgi:hypothetical protein